jgi:hypothetical protein
MFFNFGFGVWEGAAARQSPPTPLGVPLTETECAACCRHAPRLFPWGGGGGVELTLKLYIICLI